MELRGRNLKIQNINSNSVACRRPTSPLRGAGASVSFPAMHTHPSFSGWKAAVLVALLASSAPAIVAPSLTLGARTLQPSAARSELPFVDGDYAWIGGFRFFEGAASWLLGAEYSPDPGEEDLYDYALTPHLNLYFGHKWLSGGVGLRNTYLKGEEDDDWTGFYYELHLGLELPIGSRASLGIYAAWPFEEWDELDEFEFDELEYAGMFSIRF